MRHYGISSDISKEMHELRDLSRGVDKTLRTSLIFLGIATVMLMATIVWAIIDVR